MPFNVSTFSSVISDSGIARPSLFECEIAKSPIVDKLSNFGRTAQQLTFRIETVNLVGRNITTLDQNYHGPVRSMAYRQAQQNCTMTIILSEDMREREFFMQWQDYALGQARVDRNGRVYPNMFDTGYYDDYVGTVNIKQYSYGNPKTLPRQTELESEAVQKGVIGTENLNTEAKYLKYVISLEEAYPVSVNDINMSWIEEGYARLQVEFKYWFSRETHAYSSSYNLNKAFNASINFTP